MTENEQSLARRVQDQTLVSARDFFGASLGRLKDQLGTDRSQLEDLAEQLRQEEARARVQELVGSYSAIEKAIEDAARDRGIEAPTEEGSPQGPGAEDQEGQRETVGRAIQGAQETVEGAVGRAADAAGRAVGQVGQVAENLPGSQLLGRTTDEADRTVQRLVSGSGDIIEATLDESGTLVDETLVGNVAELPTEKESTTEEGHTIRTVRDESGTLIELQLGPDGSVLDLQYQTTPSRPEWPTRGFGKKEGHRYTRLTKFLSSHPLFFEASGAGYRRLQVRTPYGILTKPLQNVSLGS